MDVKQTLSNHVCVFSAIVCCAVCAVDEILLAQTHVDIDDIPIATYAPVQQLLNPTKISTAVSRAT